MSPAWRFVIPRPRYFRSLRVARVCPEISSFIDRQAVVSLKFFALSLVWWPTFGAAKIVAYGIALVASFLPELPDYHSEQIAINDEAWAILPLEEIQQRLGERGRILTKKDAPEPQTP